MNSWWMWKRANRRGIAQTCQSLRAWLVAVQCRDSVNSFYFHQASRISFLRLVAFWWSWRSMDLGDKLSKVPMQWISSRFKKSKPLSKCTLVLPGYRYRTSSHLSKGFSFETFFPSRNSYIHHVVGSIHRVLGRDGGWNRSSSINLTTYFSHMHKITYFKKMFIRKRDGSTEEKKTETEKEAGKKTVYVVKRRESVCVKKVETKRMCWVDERWEPRFVTLRKELEDQRLRCRD